MSGSPAKAGRTLAGADGARGADGAAADGRRPGRAGSTQDRDRRSGRGGRARTARSGDGYSSSRAGAERGGAGNVADRAPIVVGAYYIDHHAQNRLYAKHGAVQRSADGAQQARAVADHVNRTGGIAGHPMQLKLVRYDRASNRPYAVVDQEACEAMRSGTRPVAVVHGGYRMGLANCLKSADIPILMNWPAVAGRAELAGGPNHFFAPSSMSEDRYPALYVRGLAELGFFARGKKVGVVATTLHTAGYTRLLGALADAGVRVAVARIVPPASSASVGDIAAAIVRGESAVLRFKLAGVRRIVSIDAGGEASGIFMKAAEAHRYRPVYGLSSGNAPLLLKASVPPAQLRGAVGVGWSPLLDVGPAQEGELTSRRAQCDRIFSGAGVDTGDRTPYGQYMAYQYCDSLLLLRDALDAAGSDRSPAGVRRALESVAGRSSSALSFGRRLDAAHQDGAAGWRLLRHDDGCGCLRYEGPVRPAG